MTIVQPGQLRPYPPAMGRIIGGTQKGGLDPAAAAAGVAPSPGVDPLPLAARTITMKKSLISTEDGGGTSSLSLWAP